MKLKRIQLPATIADSLYNEFAGSHELFLDQHHVPFAIARRTSRVIRLGRETLGAAIRNIHFSKGGGTVSNKTVADVCATIMAQVQGCKDQRIVVQRLHSDDEAIYYVLDDDQIATVKKTGVSLARKRQVEFFLENGCVERQIPPALDTPPDQLPKLFREFFHLTPEQEVMFLSYVASCFVPHLNHPILFMYGAQGAAKSTALRMVKQLVDPNRKDLFSMPQKEDDLISILGNNDFVPLDNISHISGRVSDILCQAVTNGSIAKRKLYTDNDETVINLHTTIAITGVEMIITRSDLLDRSITVELERIPENKRKTEQEVWKRFHACKPQMLGAIFNALSRAMQMVEHVHLPSQFRMADFAQWGYSISETVYDNGGDLFLNAYRENIRKSTANLIGSSPLIFSLELLMSEETTWEGTPTELLMRLRDLLYQNSALDRLPYGFPVNAIVLSKKLALASIDLKTIGITVNFGRGKSRFIIIKKGDITNEQ